MIKHSEYLNKKKDAVLDNGSMTAELFDFYMGIFLAQDEFTSKAGDFEEYTDFFENDAFPVLKADELVLNDDTKSLLYDLMLKLTEVISNVNEGMDFSRFKENFKNDADSLLRGLLKQDYPFLEKKGADCRLALDEFIFVIHNVFKPFMVALKNKSGIKPGKEDWMESACPFCGYLPDMSKIVEAKENQRHLHCAICENEWEFPRLVCPACGCNDQTRHGFFEYEDNNLYRVYYCDECRHYIKNVRIPKLKEESGFDLAVEDIITNFLDAAMIDKGYKRI
ncbi:MAG TPA: formate dehydrogenase accessory protein FdhE [Spirochaetota bacterium]|nr:formate dehydrogenase accessory protein FdhE [Spirochaetota bacterium]